MSVSKTDEARDRAARRRIRIAQTSVLASLVVATSALGCNLILGLDQYRDACFEVSQGKPCPDAGAGGGGGSSTSTGSARGGSGGSSMCSPHDTRSCWGGEKKNRGVGICKDGTETCKADGSDWGPCEGEVLPKTETCASTEDEDCNHLDCVEWAQSFPDKNGLPANASADGIVVDAKDRALVFGSFVGKTIELDGRVVTNSSMFQPAAPGGYVVLLDRTGKALWGNGIGQGTFTAAAVDKDGNFYVAGSTSLEVKFSNTTIPIGQFLLKLDGGDGHVLWEKDFGGAQVGSSVGPRSMITCATGAVFMGGVYDAAIDFGNGAHSPLGGAASSYLTSFSGADGSEFSTDTFEATTIEGTFIGPFVGIDASCQRLSIVFNFAASATFRGKTITSAGGIDIGIAHIGFGVVVPVTAAFGDSKDQVALDASIAPDGTVLIAGTYQGTLNLSSSITATTTNQAALSGDGFIYASNRLFVGFGTQGKANSLEMAPDGTLFALGTFSGMLDLGMGVLDGTLGSPLLLAKFDPQGKTLWNRVIQHVQDGPLHLKSAPFSDASEAVAGGTAAFPLDLGNGALNVDSQPRAGFASRFAP